MIDEYCMDFGLDPESDTVLNRDILLFYAHRAFKNNKNAIQEHLIDENSRSRK